MAQEKVTRAANRENMVIGSKMDPSCLITVRGYDVQPAVQGDILPNEAALQGDILPNETMGVSALEEVVQPTKVVVDEDKMPTTKVKLLPITPPEVMTGYVAKEQLSTNNDDAKHDAKKGALVFGSLATRQRYLASHPSLQCMKSYRGE